MFGRFYEISEQDFSEIECESLEDFKTFRDFFTRGLKPGSREISEPDNLSSLCSPVDGTVFTFGSVDFIVKGHQYSLDEFLAGQYVKTS